MVDDLNQRRWEPDVKGVGHPHNQYLLIVLMVWGGILVLAPSTLVAEFIQNPLLEERRGEENEN